MANQEWAINQIKKFKQEIPNGLLNFNLYVYRIEKTFSEENDYTTWEDIKKNTADKTNVAIEKALGDFTSEPGIIKCIHLQNQSRIDKGGYNFFDMIATNSRPSFILKTPIINNNEVLLFRINTVVPRDGDEITEDDEKKLKTFAIESTQEYPDLNGNIIGQRINLIEASKLSDSLDINFLENYEPPKMVKKIRLTFNKFTILNDVILNAAASGVGTPTIKFPIAVTGSSSSLGVTWNLLSIFPKVNGSKLDWFSEWAWEYSFLQKRSLEDPNDNSIEASGDFQEQANEMYQIESNQELYNPGNDAEGSGIELAPFNLEPEGFTFNKAQDGNEGRQQAGSYIYNDVDVRVERSRRRYFFKDFQEQEIINGNLMYPVNLGISRIGDAIFLPAGRKYGFLNNMVFNKYYKTDEFLKDFFAGNFRYKNNLTKEQFSDDLQSSISKPNELKNYTPTTNADHRKFFALVPVANNMLTSYGDLEFFHDLPAKRIEQEGSNPSSFQVDLYDSTLWSKGNVTISTRPQYHQLSDVAIARTANHSVEFEYSEELDIHSIDIRCWARSANVTIEFIDVNGEVIRNDKIRLLTSVNEQATSLKISYNI